MGTSAAHWAVSRVEAFMAGLLVSGIVVALLCLQNDDLVSIRAAYEATDDCARHDGARYVGQWLETSPEYVAVCADGTTIKAVFKKEEEEGR